MKKQTTEQSYWIELPFVDMTATFGKSENGQTETFSGTTTKLFTLNNITISGGGTSSAYIRAYVSWMNRTLIFASPPFSVR